LTTARTRWMFGSQRRFVRRCEWDTFIPKLGCFPQISHTAATTKTHLIQLEGPTHGGAKQPVRRGVRLPSSAVGSHCR
jgi:hypothetical protein